MPSLSSSLLFALLGPAGGPQDPPPTAPAHALVHVLPASPDAPPVAPTRRFESAWVDAPLGFNELLPSWNVAGEVPFVVELRVAREGREAPSPWLHVGDWKLGADAPRAPARFDEGRVDVDYFRSERAWNRAQLRLRAVGDEGDSFRPVRVTLCFSRMPPLAGEPSFPDFRPKRALRLAVPFRRQGAERPELAPRICSPTSLAMVLDYHGAGAPTADVAARAYDAAHDLYGVWPRAIQTAFSYGVEGYVARFAGWSEVERELAAGRPLVISIAAKEGQLHGAPYASTAGHLLVLCGFTAEGDVEVADPAAKDAASGTTVYLRRELEVCWLARGGTAYVLLGATPR